MTLPVNRVLDHRLRGEHIIEPETFNFKQLVAMYGESLSDFLYALVFRHTKKDTRDIFLATTLEGIEKQKKQVPNFSIKKLGAYFRTTFRDWTKKLLEIDTDTYERVAAETRRLGVGD